MQVCSQIRYRITTGIRFAAISAFIGLIGFVLPVCAANEKILSRKDVDLYQNVFSAHSKGDYETAQDLFNKIDNKILKGYVLFDKYFSAKYVTSAQEIKDWLKEYNDLPIAARMNTLARKKGVKGLAGKESLGTLSRCQTHKRDEAIDLIRKRNFNDIKGDKTKACFHFENLALHLSEGKTLAARQLIDSGAFSRDIPTSDKALARTALAFSYFLDAEYDLALTQVEKAENLDAKATPLTYWTGGLVQWQRQKYKEAGNYFAKAAKHEGAYPLMNAGASFWAARSYLKSGDYKFVGKFLEAAAQHPQMFYGMLAIQMMGLDKNYIWSSALSGESEIDKSYTSPQLQRFFALKQLQKENEAFGELQKAFETANPTGKRAVVGIAMRYHLDEKLKSLTTSNGMEDDSYPLPAWTPNNGWVVDKALVWAVVRQESCFNPAAQSSMGAKGVMQIMPQTAEIMAHKNNVKFDKGKLSETGYNLMLGQHYIKYLLSLPAVDKNLIYMAVAYNAGPGNLIKWKKKTNYPTDPLIFIESLPSRETRIFVERIMLNYWIYQGLLGKSAITAKQIIDGKWPIYQ